MVKVKVIETRGQSALIQCVVDGELVRKIVPRSDVINGEVDEFNLETGIPYGIPWADLITISVTPEDFQRELRNAGIWTFEDLKTKQQLAVGAIQSAIGVHLGTLNNVAKEANS